MTSFCYRYKNIIHIERGEFILLIEHDSGIFSRNVLVSNHTSYLIWYKHMANHKSEKMGSMGLKLN